MAPAQAQSAAGEPGARPLQAAYGDISPFWGDISPFYGDISPFWGDISPFWGDISPFYGDISPFWGDISPFYGDISPFYGDISPFYGDISPFYGDISPFYGDISPFYGDISPFYGDIAPFWGDIAPFMAGLKAAWGDISPFGAGVEDVRGRLETLIGRSEAFWGRAVAARTGRSFRDGFVADLLARHGLDLADANSIARLGARERDAFLMEWYDGLMAFSGRDRVDHWMHAVRWSPLLAAVNGGGRSTTIGLIDFSVAREASLAPRIYATGGYQETGTGHGAAVASLLASPHDRRGLMGVAPLARIAAYNPYDQSLTAGWSDVTRGVTAVTEAGASVVNLSLGVPGWTLHPDWRNVYGDDAVQASIGRTIFVHAAGNDGTAQSQDIDWSFASQPHLLIVGSVGPTGEISRFSNTPGMACLLTGGECLERNRLMNRFIVAPGEQILVSDGLGGVVRRSGASLAAPLVTGAIALLQDRWGWLKEHPGATVDIILQTARDLGAPGVDPVYGHGLLDIAAAQNPIDARNLYVLERSARGGLVERSLRDRMRRGATSRVWGASGAFVTAFERVGDTHRDFRTPLDAVLVGTAERRSGSGERFRSHIASTLDAGGDALRVANPFGWDLSITVAPLAFTEQVRDGGMPYRTEFALTSPEGLTVRFGNGEGARVLNAQGGVREASFAAATGGANPVLGLASGGAFSSVEAPAVGSFRFNLGVTERRFKAFDTDPLTGEERPVYLGLAPYRAAAFHASASQAVTSRARLTAGYTLLREEGGLLGVQSLDPTDFATGAFTDAATLGVELTLTPRISFTGSATYARTREQGGDALGLAVNRGGLHSTAFEAAFNLEGVFGDADRARLALVQPMTIEAGSLDVRGFDVVDRTTGEIGETVRQTSLASPERRYALEALYATPILGGRGEIAAFARTGDLDERAREEDAAVAGLRFNLDF